LQSDFECISNAILVCRLKKIRVKSVKGAIELSKMRILVLSMREHPLSQYHARPILQRKHDSIYHRTKSSARRGSNIGAFHPTFQPRMEINLAMRSGHLVNMTPRRRPRPSEIDLKLSRFHERSFGWFTSHRLPHDDIPEIPEMI